MSLKNNISGFDLYQIAIETRNLEIKLFWQRSLFFAAFISSIFIGYSRGSLDDFLKILLTIFGMLISLAWGLANRGSKYWYESWELKVKEIEENLGINLFNEWKKPQDKSFLYSGRLYSVSKISIYLSDLICFGWFVLFVKNTLKLAGNNISSPITITFPGWIPYFLIVFFLVLMTILLVFGTRTDVHKNISEKWKNI